MLVSGFSVRSISRVVDVSINTVTKRPEDAGGTYLALHDGLTHDMKAPEVQCDKI